MLSKTERFRQVLISALVFSIVFGPSPVSSVTAIAVLLAYSVADKYFHDTFFDENKQAIAQLRADYSKLKVKQDHADLKGAFGGKSGG